MEEEIYVLIFSSSVAQSFPFYLFNGGGTSSRLPIGCVLIQSQPEEGECCLVFLRKNINLIFIFNLLFCWKKKKKKPHSASCRYASGVRSALVDIRGIFIKPEECLSSSPT